MTEATTEPSFADRLRRHDDLDAIRRLAMTYKGCLDAKDFAGYANLFARDGVLDCGPDLQASGPAAILAMVQGMQGELLTEEAGADAHLNSNHRIELDGDRASGTQTWIYVLAGPDGNPQLSKIGHYEDEYVREDGQWRFARRAAPMDIPNS